MNYGMLLRSAVAFNINKIFLVNKDKKLNKSGKILK